MHEIRNARLPDGRTVCIRHAGGRIISIGTETSPKAICLDAKGLWAVPALNLMHVHFRVPGGELKEDWETGSLAAIAGGVAVVGDMPNTKPSLTTAELFYRKIELIGAPRVRYMLWFGATARNAGEIRLVAGHPLLAGVKVFMGSSTGALLVDKLDDQRRVFELCVELGLLLAVHAEDERVIQANRGQFPNPRTADHGRIRSIEAAVAATRQALALQAETGCRLLILHVSTVEEAELILDAKEQGQEVYAETCPHYWAFDDSMLSRPDGAFFKMNPPLRPASQRGRYLELLGREGVFDLIAPDHAPHTRVEKGAKDYDSVPSGIPGVQELFPLTLCLVMRGVLSVERFIELTSTNAARLFGLPNGRLEPGYAADIVLFDPSKRTMLRHEDMRSKCGWTPYDGLDVYGVPQVVYVDGEVALNRNM